MRFSPREKLLFAAPLLALALAFSPSHISEILFQRMPDRIVIANNNPLAITKLRMVVWGHPNHIITVENIPAFSKTWRAFNQNWAEQVTGLWRGQHGALIHIEGVQVDGMRFGYDRFYYVKRSIKPTTPVKLVITVHGREINTPEFHPSNRFQNESFWRDLGDALFHQPEERQNVNTKPEF